MHGQGHGAKGDKVAEGRSGEGCAAGRRRADHRYVFRGPRHSRHGWWRRQEAGEHIEERGPAHLVLAVGRGVHPGGGRGLDRPIDRYHCDRDRPLPPAPKPDYQPQKAQNDRGTRGGRPRPDHPQQVGPSPPATCSPRATSPGAAHRSFKAGARARAAQPEERRPHARRRPHAAPARRTRPGRHHLLRR
jgi:hypothetical protein